MTRPGTWPVSRHRSTRGAVHSSGFTLRPLPTFTAAAGLTASMCGTRSASDDEATASTRLIRASVSGRVEVRLPSLDGPGGEQAPQQVGAVRVGLGPVDQPHRRGEVPEMVVAQVGEPQVPERREQVQVGGLAVAGQRATA